MAYPRWRTAFVRIAMVSHAFLSVYWLVVLAVAFRDYRVSGSTSLLAAAWVVAATALLIPVIVVLLATVCSVGHWMTLGLGVLLWLTLLSLFGQSQSASITIGMYVVLAIFGTSWWMFAERARRIGGVRNDLPADKSGMEDEAHPVPNRSAEDSMRRFIAGLGLLILGLGAMGWVYSLRPLSGEEMATMILQQGRFSRDYIEPPYYQTFMTLAGLCSLSGAALLFRAWFRRKDSV